MAAGHVSYSSTVLWKGGRVTRAVGIGGAEGVNLALERLKALSVPLAPLDRGPLRESATVKPATPTKAEGALIFDTPYAAVQHEELDYNHDDGQAKYVEQPMKERQSELHGLIGRRIAVRIADA